MGWGHAWGDKCGDRRQRFLSLRSPERGGGGAEAKGGAGPGCWGHGGDSPSRRLLGAGQQLAERVGL